MATDLIYVAPNPLSQDSLVPCSTLSRILAWKLNHLAEQFLTILLFLVWSFSCLLKLCDFSFQAKKGYEEMEKLSQAAREQAADAEDKYVHVVLW